MTRLEKIRTESRELSGEVREKVVGYIVAAFGLIAGLAWNDAVKALIEQFIPSKQNSLLAKFGYAALISIVVIAVSMYLVRLTKKKEVADREKTNS